MFVLFDMHVTVVDVVVQLGRNAWKGRIEIGIIIIESKFNSSLTDINQFRMLEFALSLMSSPLLHCILVTEVMLRLLIR